MIYGDVLNKKVIAIPQPRLEGSMIELVGWLACTRSYPGRYLVLAFRPLHVTEIQSGPLNSSRINMTVYLDHHSGSLRACCESHSLEVGCPSFLAGRVWRSYLRLYSSSVFACGTTRPRDLQIGFLTLEPNEI